MAEIGLFTYAAIAEIRLYRATDTPTAAALTARMFPIPMPLTVACFVPLPAGLRVGRRGRHRAAGTWIGNIRAVTAQRAGDSSGRATADGWNEKTPPKAGQKGGKRLSVARPTERGE